MVKKYLTDSQLIQDGWIQNDWVKSNLYSQKLDVRHINKLLGILELEM